MHIGLLVLGSLAVALAIGLMLICAGVRLLADRDFATEQLLIAPRGSGFGVAGDLVRAGRPQARPLAVISGPDDEPASGRRPLLVVLPSEAERATVQAA